MQQITKGEREILAQSMSQFRRSIIREFVAGIVRAFGNLHRKAAKFPGKPEPVKKVDQKSTDELTSGSGISKKEYRG